MFMQFKKTLYGIIVLLGSCIDKKNVKKIIKKRMKVKSFGINLGYPFDLARIRWVRQSDGNNYAN